MLVDGFAIAEEPVLSCLLGFDEVEGVCDQLGGLGVTASGELALDALFGGGIEVERHGESIAGCGLGVVRS